VFETRADTLELLDRDDIDEALALQSYRFMSIVNRYFGGTAVVKDFIATKLRHHNRSEPLRILDIGSGACDIPAAICKWAQKAGFAIEFTCVEPSEYAAQAAQQNIRQHGNIKLVQEDIFKYQPSQEYDCAIGSLFLHHLSDGQITHIIGRLRNLGCGSVLINDLNRSPGCYIGCLLACVFVPAGVRHDALLSVRKGFRPDELGKLLASIPAASVSIYTSWFGRVCAIIRFDAEGNE
jgi:2-polyprenyl-3-methyl-5-hydroxy-6-metoxy-1,4-benzoquinol methylase